MHTESALHPWRRLAAGSKKLAAQVTTFGYSAPYLCAWLLTIAIVATAAPASAEAACQHWNVTQPFSFEQSNTVGVDVALTQRGNNLSGRARQTFVPRRGPGVFGALGLTGGDPQSLTGTIDGVISGATLSLKISWSNGSIGMYSLQIDESGRLSGETYDFHKPSSRAQITGYDRISCVDAAAPPAKPVHRLGKIHAPETTAQPISSGAACQSGWVWREARPGDTVCVLPATRTETSQENRLAASRRVSGGSNCLTGFVWRQAYPGDLVCVTPGSRARAQADNRSATSRVASTGLLPVLPVHSSAGAAPATQPSTAPATPSDGGDDTAQPSTQGSEAPASAAQVLPVPVTVGGVVMCQPSTLDSVPQVPETVGGTVVCQPSGGVLPVWVNGTTHVYHCKGDPQYGNTKKGMYMSEADALAQGNRAANGKACS